MQARPNRWDEDGDIVSSGRPTPVVTPTALAPWVEDAYAGCIPLIAGARGIPSQIASAPRWQGSPPVPWLAFRVGARDYLFRLGTLLVGGRGHDITTFTMVNGDMPALSASKAAAGSRSRRSAALGAGGAGQHWILELNRAPGFTSFYLPLQGVQQDVCGDLLDRLRDEQW